MSRELDREVAEMVFGMTVEGFWMFDDHIGRGLPHYSTRIEDAWKLLADWQDYDIQRRNGWYTVEVYVPSREAKASAESLPLAICRAVLLAARRGMIEQRPKAPVAATATVPAEAEGGAG